LTFRPAEPFTLISTHQERHDNAAFQRRNADTIRTFETDVLTHAERHSGMFAEMRAFFLVALVGFDDLRETANRGIGWQSETLAYLRIAEFLQDELVGDLAGVRDTSAPVGSSVEPFNCFTQLLGGVQVGQQLDLQGQLHAPIILGYSSKYKGGAGAILE
jgi:hypothetical protein